MTQAIFTLKNTPLEGRFVRLEPYRDSLKTQVSTVLNCDSQAWNLFMTNGQGEGFEPWWSLSLLQVQTGQRIAYAIRHLADDRIVGVTSFLNIRPERLCVEIGATFLHPDWRSTTVNPECKWLMLQHAFVSGTRRVEFFTDARNTRSQAALTKLGAIKEGVLRRERVTWTGHIRDSVLFAITDLDWPGVEQDLKLRLSAGNLST